MEKNYENFNWEKYVNKYLDLKHIKKRMMRGDIGMIMVKMRIENIFFMMIIYKKKKN